MASKFKLQIVDSSNRVVASWEPGLSVECNFIDDCVTSILKKGVGVFRTSTHVEKDIRHGIEETIQALKDKVRP